MSTATTAIEHAAPPESGPRAFIHRLRHGDEVAHLVTLIFAATILLVTSAMVYELWLRSKLTRDAFGLSFFWTNTWDPVFDHFGAAPFIYGTLLTSILSLAIALPLGLSAAIFLAELAPRSLSDSVAFLVDLLAAVPSVIYGLLGIFIVVPLMRTTIGPALKHTLGFLPFFSGPNYGVGILTASIVLAVMIVPFIISVSREVLLTVPRDQREAALALGATRWESTWNVVVPWARTGIMGSVFLALARALGETMAVTMVIGGTPKIPASLFSTGYTIAAAIADEFAEAVSGMHRSALMELGLVLFLITFILNGLARLLIVATERGGGGRPS